MSGGVYGGGKLFFMTANCCRSLYGTNKRFVAHFLNRCD